MNCVFTFSDTLKMSVTDLGHSDRQRDFGSLPAQRFPDLLMTLRISDFFPNFFKNVYRGYSENSKF